MLTGGHDDTEAVGEHLCVSVNIPVLMSLGEHSCVSVNIPVLVSVGEHPCVSG